MITITATQEPQPTFRKITVSFNLNSLEELTAIYNLSGRNLTVPSLVAFGEPSMGSKKETDENRKQWTEYQIIKLFLENLRIALQTRSQQ